MARFGINKVILIGNLGQDPEVRYMQNNNAVANISIATTESWKDKQTGEAKERTEWHRVVVYGKLAEIAGEYLRKGSQVYVEGQLQTRKWQDQSGQDNYITEVIVNPITGTLQFLGGNSQKAESTTKQTTSESRYQYKNSLPNQTPANQTNHMDFDDDIPF